MDIYEEIRRGVMDGDAKKVKALTEKAMALRYSPEAVLKNSLMMGMQMLARKYAEEAVSVPEAMLTTRAFNMGLRVVIPYLKGQDAPKSCRAVIGTVEGDLHDIGKNLVKTYLSTLDIEIIDLGVDVSKERFCQAVREYQPRLLLISTLLLTSLEELRDVIEELKKQGLRGNVIVFVGGQPVTPEFARDAGADYYSRDALELRNFLAKNLSKLLKVKKSNT